MPNNHIEEGPKSLKYAIPLKAGNLYKVKCQFMGLKPDEMPLIVPVGDYVVFLGMVRDVPSPVTGTQANRPKFLFAGNAIMSSSAVMYYSKKFLESVI